MELCALLEKSSIIEETQSDSNYSSNMSLNSIKTDPHESINANSKTNDSKDRKIYPPEISLRKLHEKYMTTEKTPSECSYNSNLSLNRIKSNSHQNLKANSQANKSIKNSISLLQEHLSIHSTMLPKYELIVKEGPPHDQLFYIECTVGSKFTTQGVGKSKKIAKEEAALKMMKKIEINFEKTSMFRNEVETESSKGL